MGNAVNVMVWGLSWDLRRALEAVLARADNFLADPNKSHLEVLVTSLAEAANRSAKRTNFPPCKNLEPAHASAP